MNYFLLFIIVGVCGGSYYMYTQDQEQIRTLQQQVTDLTAQMKTGGTATAATTTSNPTTTGGSLATVQPLSPAPSLSSGGVTPATVAPVTTVAPTPVVAPVAPAAVMANQPGHFNAIDAAANAAIAASNGSSIGTVTTLDHKTYTNCKVLKVETDGVTFSHDDGITKILYPMMTPDVQQKFGYTPQGAVAQTEAQIRADQQASASTNAPNP